MKTVDINIDGASKGNPGPAGIGIIICENQQVVRNVSSFIGIATNNIAEYQAFITALEEGLLLKADCLNIKTDSQLLARQVNGEYKVKNTEIKVLFDKAKHLMQGFKSVKVTHIDREDNKGADKLANLSLKKQARVVAR